MSLVGGSLLRHSLDYPLEDVEAEILVDYEKASDDLGLNHQDIEHRKEFPLSKYPTSPIRTRS